MNSFNGLRVLITRPAQQADKWRDYLESLGAQTLTARLMEVIPFREAIAEDRSAVVALKQKIQNLDHYQHVIFVSQNAVHFGYEWISQYWPQIPIGLHFHAVGSSTAKLLQHFDIIVEEAGGSMNSEALLATPLLNAVAGQKVLIVRGQGGRPVLAEVLEKRGAIVEYAELYRRELPSATQQQLQASDWGRPGDVVALHSGESLQNWQHIILSSDKEEWRSLPLLVPGERVAEQASLFGFTSIIMADNATDSVMAQALLDWHHNRT